MRSAIFVPADHVAAPPTLPDVVQEHSQEEGGPVLGLREHLDEGRGHALLAPRDVVEGGHRLQGVLVHRVAVEVVVLDEERDARELGDEAAQEPGLVQLAQRGGDSAGTVEEPEEGAARVSRRAELHVHLLQPLAHRVAKGVAQGHALGLGHRHALQHPDRPPLEPRPPSEELAALDLESRHHARTARLRRGHVVEQEAHGELVELRRAPVVVAHEELGGEEAAAGLVAEALGELRLQVEGQEVGAASRVEVGLVADAGEEVVGPARDHVVLVAQPPLAEEAVEPAAPVEGVAEPDHGVEVAEPAHALLDVGLLQTHRASPPRVPLQELRAHEGEEVAGGARVSEPRLHMLRERGEELGAARDEARLGERRAGVEVRAREGHALAGRADGVAHVQAHVPEELEGALHEAADTRRDLARVQEEEVHVGVRSELAAPVAAEGDHRALDELAAGLAVRLLRRHLADAGDHEVHLVAAAARDLGPAEPQAVPHAQPLRLEPQEAAEGLDVIGSRVPERVPFQRLAPRKGDPFGFHGCPS